MILFSNNNSNYIKSMMKKFTYIFLTILTLFIGLSIYKYSSIEWITFLGIGLLITAAIIMRKIELKQLQITLNKSHESALENMIYLVNLHDKETGEHILRTKHYAKALADYLYQHQIYSQTITPRFIEYLFKACPLHDIGKIGIPDAVLKKPDILTSEEYDIIKQHPSMGKNIVDQAMIFYDKNSLLNMVHDVVYYHHEKWDGTGYPCKLKGEEIPLSAQIMALCDVYDALVSKRRYKSSFSYEKADAIILSGKGKSFNPILVDAFYQIRPSFHEISNKWREESA